MHAQRPFFPAVLLITLLAISCARANLYNELQQSFLTEHNRIRESASPKASGMLHLVWNSGLANNARAQAISLSSTRAVWHINMGDSWLSYQTWEFEVPSAWRVVDAWHSTKRSYRISGVCTGDDENCQPYRQIMNDKLESIGCSYLFSYGMHTFVCYYSHRAAEARHPVYAAGEPCTACPNRQPLCLNNLCIDSQTAAHPSVTVFSGSDPSQGLFCTRDCDTCKNGGFGNCRECVCQNGGIRLPNASPTNCKCDCLPGFYGHRCQVKSARYYSSVVVRLAVYGPGKLSMSMFNSMLWAYLQKFISESVNSFCRSSEDRFRMCCTKNKYTQEVASSQAKFVDPKWFIQEPDLFQENPDGSFILYIRATVSEDMRTNMLCYHSDSDRRNPTAGGPDSNREPQHIPPYLIQEAIRYDKYRINDKLLSCCKNAMLKDAYLPAYATSGAPGREPTASTAGWVAAIALMLCKIKRFDRPL